MRVLLQAGHHPSGGGAPGESSWCFHLAHRIAAKLEAAGVECAVVGDWLNKPPPPQTREDWDLFLALHYDAAIYGDGKNTGCFADRATGDPMAGESDRFIALWETTYPGLLGIPLRNSRRNANTSQYYAFRDTTARTPGVIIEHGCGAPVGTGGFPPGEDAGTLHDRIDEVAEADALAAIVFLGAAAPAPPTEDIGMSRIAELEAILRDVQADREWNFALKMRFEAELRMLEAKRRLKRGTVERLIAEVRRA